MPESIKSAEEIPGTDGLPFLGDAIDLFTLKELYYWNCFQRYGNIFKAKILGMHVAFLVGPDANQFVLKDCVDRFSSEIGYSFLEPILGGGILLQDGDKHQATRRLMSPAFHGRAVANYFDTIQNTSNRFLKNQERQGEFLLIEFFRKLTLEISCKLFLGTKTTHEIDEIGRLFSDFVEGQLTILRLDTPMTKFGRALEGRRRIEGYIHSAIDQRRRQEDFNASQDVLGLLMTSIEEEGRCLSDSEIVTQSLQLLFAGHETSAKLLCWLLFELAFKPEWVKRLREEQNCVIGNGLVTPFHLRQLTQMNYVLKEIERLYPPVYGIPRGVVRDVIYAGYHIPHEWQVVISPLLTHRMSELYTNPDLFDPDRFAPPREEHKKHPFALIGFGGGAHKCLGYELAQMEIKITLLTLLRHYNWIITPAYLSTTPVRQPTEIERILKIQILKRSTLFTPPIAE